MSFLRGLAIYFAHQFCSKGRSWSVSGTPQTANVVSFRSKFHCPRLCSRIWTQSRGRWAFHGQCWLLRSGLGVRRATALDRDSKNQNYESNSRSKMGLTGIIETTSWRRDKFTKSDSDRLLEQPDLEVLSTNKGAAKPTMFFDDRHWTFSRAPPWFQKWFVKSTLKTRSFIFQTLCPWMKWLVPKTCRWLRPSFAKQRWVRGECILSNIGASQII